jgi:hypothetical protein
MRCAGLRHPVTILCLIGSLSQAATADEDAYLSEISAEAKKIDVESQPVEGKVTQDANGSSSVSAAQQAFEDDLKSRYMGSSLFTKSSPGELGKRSTKSIKVALRLMRSDKKL